MKIHFIASRCDEAQAALVKLTQEYGQTRTAKHADIIVSVGGDGTTLHALQKAIKYDKPVYGINLGTVGFLQNPNRDDDDLIARMKAAEILTLCPLRANAHFKDGSIRSCFAINEIHVCNHNRAEGIHLRVTAADGEEFYSRVSGDGMLVATAIGSTGYNEAAGGPILLLNDAEIVLTPNNAYMPKNTEPRRTAPKPITVAVINPHMRRADIYYDNHHLGNTVTHVEISMAYDHPYRLLVDPGFTARRNELANPSPEG